MSSEDKAQAAKTEGTKAWQSGNYPRAIQHFSEAIDHTSSSNKELLKILYSNRSAAWLKVNKASEALSDGEKCVSLDNQWTKGYTRKGDALYALKRYTDAYNAYNAGLRVDANDSTLKEKAEQAMRAIRNASNSTTSSSSTSSSSTTGSTAPANGQLRLAKMAVIVLGFVYLIPFLGSINGLAYRGSAGIYAGLNALAIYQKYGMPKFSSEYAAQIFPDPAMMRLFLGAFLAFSLRPYFFALVPVMLTELTSFTGEIFNYVRDNADKLEGQIVPLIQRFMPQVPRVSLNQLFNPALVPQANEAILRMAASCEVSQGLFHIVELLLPSRSLITLYLWWQYLRMRYMMDRSGHVKAAFYDMDQKITQLLNYPMVPGIIRTGYNTIKGYMSKQVETPTAPPQSTGGASSLLSKCTIM